MSIALTDDDRGLAGLVRGFAEDANLMGETRALVEGAGHGLPASWTQLSNLGLTGVAIPEEYGGGGAGLAEAAIVADELGFALGPVSALTTVALAATIASQGTADQKAKLLPGLADGSVPAGVGLTSDAILGGRGARLIAVVHETDLVLLPLEALVQPVYGFDPSCGGASLRDRAVLDAGIVIAGAAAPARDALRTLAAAAAAGGIRATLAGALEYAKVREQFGRPIGGFQAVKHKLADMFIASELATGLAWDAVRGGAEDERAFASAAAAEYALDAYCRAAERAIQIYGAIGFTWEHDAHLHLRRARVLAAVVGTGTTDDVYESAARGVRRMFSVSLPPEAETYRGRARDFVSRYEAAPEGERRRLLAESGYLVPHWPSPLGLGADAVEQLVVDEELRDVELPRLGIGGWVMQTISQVGTPDQVRRWVVPGLAGDLRWCQMFSEPGAGSDAAAVRTRAVRDQDGWRLTGQKVWTSGAGHCTHGLATIRTDSSVAKHRGITLMVIDLSAPGVTVRPLREITGDELFAEVFLDDVFVPDSDVLGGVNEGWPVARATFGNERVAIGGGSLDNMSAHTLIPLARKYHTEDLSTTRAIARLVVEEHALDVLNLRQATRAVLKTDRGAEGNVTKLVSAEHAQHVTELGMQITGAAAVMGKEPGLSRDYLFNRCLTVAGGTSEITRNVIAERLLGLPREPA